MKHPNEARLKALVDAEVGDEEREMLAAHLAVCAPCRTVAESLSAQATRVQARLGLLTPFSMPEGVAAQDSHATTGSPSASAAWTRFKRRYEWTDGDNQDRKETIMKRLFSGQMKWVTAVGAVLALLLLSLTFEPVRVWAGGLLKIFRIEQIAVVPIDPTRLSELNPDSTLGKQLGQLMSDSIRVTQEATKPRAAANAAAASQMAGFPVRLWAAAPSAPALTVQGGGAFEFTINHAKAQAVLNEVAGGSLTLPANIDGALVKVVVPLGVSAAYNCPPLSEEGRTGPLKAAALRNCIVLAQMPSPTVDVPDKVDVNQLALIGLRAAGMPEKEARAFVQSVDWTSTLVVPIPRDGTVYKQVQVDGVQGTLIYRARDEGMPERYLVLWVREGIVYALNAYGDATQGANFAAALVLK